MSSSDPRVHFGLASESKISQVEIRWPSGHPSASNGPAVDQILAIDEPRALQALTQVTFPQSLPGDLIVPTSERLYYSDSFLKTFTASVVDVCELADPNGGSIWQLALDRSAFYPTSGGQPFDTGLLRAVSPGGAATEVAIEQVEEDEDGRVWHFARQPLPKGTHVEAQLEWERRFDHMQQHTGQHLLSAVFSRSFSCQPYPSIWAKARRLST